MKFGTDGIRGPAGEPPIDEGGARRIGQAAARLAQGAGGASVLIAGDTRPSSAALCEAVARGVVDRGLRAVLAGTAPTSAVATGVQAGLGHSGVMVTASHNPAPDNGFKVFAPGGRKPSDDEVEQIERWLAESGPSLPGGSVVHDPEGAWRTYTDALAIAAGDLAPLAGRRFAVDLANGAAAELLPWLQEHTDARWTAIGAGPGTINDGVGAVHPQALAAVLAQGGFDGGFAVDGDADRCVLLDERGGIVSGDGLAWLLARGAGTERLGVTVMSNAALEQSLPGVSVVRTPVGDKHLQRLLLAGEITLGAEESGHVLFHDGLAGGDGVLTGLRALAFAMAGGGVARAVSGFVPFPSALTKVRVRHRLPLEQVAPLQAAIASAEQTLGAGSRVFLRYSGTEPVLRVLVEGREAASVQSESRRLTELAREVLG